MKFIKKIDVLIISGLLIVGLVAWLFWQFHSDGRQMKAEIYYKSELVETVTLTEGIDKTFSIPEKPNVVFHQYPDKSICFEESDCPDKICVRTGRIHRAGESAACLPNEIIMKIVASGKDDSGPDVVIG